MIAATLLAASIAQADSGGEASPAADPAEDPATAAADSWIAEGSWYALLGVGLLLASMGASTAAALLGYSPTRLARAPGGPRVQKLLEHHGTEFEVLGRVLTVLGLLAAGVAWWSLGASRSLGIVLVFLSTLSCGALPTRLAEHHAEPLLVVHVPRLNLLRRLLRFVLLKPLMTLSGWLLKLLRVPTSPAQHDDAVADEILTAVSDSAREAELPDEERHWIENIVELKSMDATGVMTPRTEVFALPREMPLSAAVQKALDAGFSRFPVYRDTVDQIVGVFYAKDALQLIADPSSRAEDMAVGDLIRDAAFVGEQISLVELLRHFRITKKQLAIVTDEYGGTSGVVTLEDVLEEIVGEIEDEYDPESAPAIEEVEPGRIIDISGRLRIDEANEHLGERLPETDDYDTLAGWVFTRLNRVPAAGERLEIDGITVEVLAADDRRIDRLRLELPVDATGPRGAVDADGRIAPRVLRDEDARG